MMETEEVARYVVDLHNRMLGMESQALGTDYEDV